MARRAAVRIRDAAPGERAALEDLQRRSADIWPEYRAQLAAHPEMSQVDPEAIAHCRVRVAVAGAGGAIVGFSVVLGPIGRGVELDGLFVDPPAMRRGVGRALVEDAAATAHAIGATHLDVIANPGAAPFYASVGFTPDGEATTAFGPAPRMTRAL
jgi:GNAT superfamily N-acetyltransferase